MEEHLYGRRRAALERDPDFQEYADLRRAFEEAKGTFRQQNIPHAIGLAPDGTPIKRVSWIARRLREIPIQLQHLKAKYGGPEGLDIPRDADIATTLSDFGDDLLYQDRVLLERMQEAQMELPLEEARYIREWVYVEALIDKLAASRYARRMDPAVYGPPGSRPPRRDGWFAVYEPLDLAPGQYSATNAQRKVALISELP